MVECMYVSMRARGSGSIWICTQWLLRASGDLNTKVIILTTDHSARKWVYRRVSDYWPVWRQTYGYLSNRRT